MENKITKNRKYHNAILCNAQMVMKNILDMTSKLNTEIDDLKNIILPENKNEIASSLKQDAHSPQEKNFIDTLEFLIGKRNNIFKYYLTQANIIDEEIEYYLFGQIPEGIPHLKSIFKSIFKYDNKEMGKKINNIKDKAVTLYA